MDKQYLDAKFDGMEKLMTAQHANLTNHINAVSSNVKRVDLAMSASYASTNTANGLWGRVDPVIAVTGNSNSWACKWNQVTTTAKCQVICARMN